MNPGKLRARGTLLRLSGEADLTWEPLRSIWLSGAETGRKNLFSKVGIGAAGAEFLVRQQDLTLNDAIFWSGQHYFLTDLTKEGWHPVYFKLQAARVTPQLAAVLRDTIHRDKLGRPIRKEQPIGSFPACLTEKYLGSSAEPSHIEQTERLIAVAPKAAQYLAGDLFVIGGQKYRVMVVHALEDYKNEYEIERVLDD